ncbi:MAG TPA: polyketide cyclase [Planctomycetaceae bacterium]|nr:polyketide cyclase [Planctomycetaceae bacterium]
MMKSLTIACSINRPPSEVYQFASNPANLPKWIRSFCLSVKQSEGAWLMETATGCIEIQFVPANEFGVLDHVVKLADGQSIRNSMRVVPNGDGSEVMFTLLQLPEMNERQFVKDVAMVETDLLTLKDVLEGGESVD